MALPARVSVHIASYCGHRVDAHSTVRTSPSSRSSSITSRATRRVSNGRAAAWTPPHVHALEGGRWGRGSRHERPSFCSRPAKVASSRLEMACLSLTRRREIEMFVQRFGGSATWFAAPITALALTAGTCGAPLSPGEGPARCPHDQRPGERKPAPVVDRMRREDCRGVGRHGRRTPSCDRGPPSSMRLRGDPGCSKCHRHRLP